MAETVAEAAAVADPGAEQCAAQINKTKGQTALGVGAVAPPFCSVFDSDSGCCSLSIYRHHRDVPVCVCASTFGIGT